jgi:hypothetical protein
MTDNERDEMMHYVMRLRDAGEKMVTTNLTGNWYQESVQEWKQTVAEVIAQIVVRHG